MRYINIGIEWGQALAFSSLLWVTCSSAAGMPISADEIIRKAVARSEHPDSSAQKRSYAYTKISITDELDSSGKVKDEKRKVWQIRVNSGHASARLTEVDGRPPPAAELKKQAEAENNAHQILGEGHSGNLENRDNLLTQQMVDRFNFNLMGTTNLAGRLAYVLTFSPKSPPLPVHHMVDRLLNQLSGTVWIDTEEFELARADLRSTAPVDFWGGLIGSLKHFLYTVTRTRVADGLWVKTTASGDFEGRKLVEPIRIRTKSEIKDLRLQATAKT